MPLSEVLDEAERLDELERHERLVREADALRLAYLVNYAVNDPRRLNQEATAFHARLWATPTAPATAAPRRGPLTAEERTRVAALVATLATAAPARPLAPVT